MHFAPRTSMTAQSGIASVDTETTGLHPFHGCYPFMVTACVMKSAVEAETKCWEWLVNPETRKPRIPVRERKEVEEFLHSYHLIMHHAQFDYRMLSSIGIRMPDWSQVDDTIHASHVLHSGEQHGLKMLAMMHADIEPDDEADLREATIKARLFGKSQGWNIAHKGHPNLPGDKETLWKADYWTPRAAALAQDLPLDHPWHTLCRTYGIRDAERTLLIWCIFREQIFERGLEQQYLMRQKQLEVTYSMQTQGVTVHRPSLASTQSGYSARVAEVDSKAIAIVDHSIDNMGSNKQLQAAMFTILDCKKLKQTKTGFSTEKEVLEEMLTYHGPRTKEYHFIRCLQDRRSLTKAVEALTSYEAFSSPRSLYDQLSSPKSPGDSPVASVLNAYFRMHPNFNICGTRTLRYASDDPNQQNVSKKKNFNLRSVFGPLPGRVWYSLDYNNIEMRIFAWESGDEDLITAFESGRAAHLVIAEVLYPELMAKLGDTFKKEYESTLYQWVKNGNFSLIYGAGQRKADATYRVKGAYQRIRRMLPRIDQFLAAKHCEALEKGYIETLGGYQLQVETNEPHKAVNYFCQGSAGYAMILALIRVHEYLRPYSDHRLIMTVHDQIILDFPAGHPDNHKHMLAIKALMEQSGQELKGIPLPTDVEIIQTTWDKGVKVDLAAAA